MRFFNVAVTDEVQPKAGELALAADARVGQPDLGNQVAGRERGHHARVDLVGLARQRGQTLDLGRVGDQHVPAVLLEAVVNEPRAVHRLDHAAHGEPHMPARAARPRSPSASGGDAHSSTISPTPDNRQTSTFFRLRSSPACNMKTGLLELAPR
jgi:hypothetical protein